jgi:hypothetical protein
VVSRSRGGSSSASSSLVELAGDAFTAALTGGAGGWVVLQAVAPRQADLADRERTYVARYARIDRDARAFVLRAAVADEDERTAEPDYQFLRPESWGFTPSITGMHWTAHNLFRRSPVSIPSTSTKPSTGTRPRFKDVFDDAAEPAPDRGDPFQCTPQLRQIRQQFDARANDAMSNDPGAAYALALGLGRCRLFGVRLADAEDFTLTPGAFEIAATHLAGRLRIATERSGHRIVDAHGAGHLHHNVALELLEQRMDAHAAYLALDEAYAAARYESHPDAEQMSVRLNRVRRLISLFDGNLKNQLPLLRLAASTYLLDNWRRLLAPVYRDLPPWWLDGCLEDARPQ